MSAGGNKTTLISSITDDQTAAVAAAKGADTAIVFVNADSGEYQPIPVNWSTGDRTNNNLWWVGFHRIYSAVILIEGCLLNDQGLWR